MDFLIFAQSQITVPSISNWWQLAGFLSLLALNAYSMYLNSQNKKETNNKIVTSSIVTQAKIEQVADKTEIVHKSVNSQLDAFKKDAADQYKTALEQGIAVVRLTLEKDSNIKTSALEARIAALEGKLESERQKSLVLVTASKLPDPPARLEEIRGNHVEEK